MSVKLFILIYFHTLPLAEVWYENDQKLNRFQEWLFCRHSFGVIGFLISENDVA
jgi:hypothetical protein